MSSRISLTVVVPCYNEEAVIDRTIARLDSVCRACSADYELICVDDGSADETWACLLRLRETYASLKAIKLSRNFGHQAAVTAGLHYAKGMDVLLIDADLQDPPELLPEMLKQRELGFDVVYGRRLSRAGESSLKRWTAWLFYRLINWLSDVPIPCDTGDFRLMSRRAVDGLNRMPEQTRFIRGMVAWIGYRQTHVSYKRDARAAGETKYTLRKMLRFSADAITSFSTKPLRLASILGLAMLVGFAFILLWALWTWSYGVTVPGWTSIVCVVLLVGGCQTLLLGVIGEYLGRLFIEAKSRPLYLVSDSAGLAENL